MTRRVHTPIGGKESARAFAAYQAYRSLGAGRSLERLCQQFKAQAQAHRTDPNVPLPPSTNLDTLKGWSARWGWAARLAVEQAEAEAARTMELQRLAVQQARQDHELARQVGTGSLGICALALQSLANPEGGLRREINPKEIAPLARASVYLLSWAHGGTVQGEATQADPNGSLEKVLQEAPTDVRQTVARGLRALCEWQEAHKGPRQNGSG